MIGRRGFLQSLAAAAGIAAAFDPLKNLWVPASAETQAHTLGSLGSTPLVAESTSAAVEIQVELNAMAKRYAQLLGQELRSSKDAFALNRVIYEHTGSVQIPINPPILRVAGIGAGWFEPLRVRLLKPQIAPLSPSAEKQESWLHGLARDAAWGLKGVEAYAPISGELRPGVSFSGDVQIGIGTDEETGLSVRALRWTHEASGAYLGSVTLTGFEVAGGHWRRRYAPDVAKERARAHYREFGDPYGDKEDEENYVADHASDFEED